MTAINPRICHEIPNKRIVPISGVPCIPRVDLKPLRPLEVVEILCGVSPSKRKRANKTENFDHLLWP